ncbi:MAG: cysteine desulfurase NifS [Clostridia bacterium]|nr:cysteine desulfurase NifS [Clostridia bacterium]
MAKTIYMDHAATTPVAEAVAQKMLPYFTQSFGNPSSIHHVGRANRAALDNARAQVAKALGAANDEIFFTSGGSEGDNWAIKGVMLRDVNRGKKFITTNIEHHAVLHTGAWLEKHGYEVIYLPVNEYGVVTPDVLEAAMGEGDTALVSIMFANNEIGTIEPIKELAEVAHRHGALFHTDAVQAIGAVAIDVKALNVDMLSLSAHKFYGPKGVGAMYVRKGVYLENLIEGGAQERGKRAGTENIPGIVGLGAAIELATENLEKNAAYLTSLRDDMIAQLLEKIPHTRLNGHPTDRLPANVNVSIEYIEGESMLILLDQNGICASSGSACTSGSLDPSHVLLAIGLPHEVAHGSLRFSLGIHNTKEEVDQVVELLVKIVERLRAMSPLYHA